jgi:HAD superfamily hydrolase (TIGR01549 family)
VSVSAVLFDVDFTLCRPGPELQPEAYAERGRAYDLRLEPELFEPSRRAALAELQRHPELAHEDELWISFSEQIIHGMGGEGAGVRALAEAMVLAWEQAEHFELYDDVLPVFAELRRHGLKLGLVSNTARDLPAFVVHHRLDVDVAIDSREHGKTKPDPSIFAAALAALAVEPQQAAMVGDSPEDDIAGALALGLRAFLLDRGGDYPGSPGRLSGLDELPAALGLRPARDGRTCLEEDGK